jgi:hypothetical protein
VLEQGAASLNHNIDFACGAQRQRQLDVDLIEALPFQLGPSIKDRNPVYADEGFAHERRTLRRIAPQRFLEDLFDLLQAFHRTLSLICSSTARSSSERA